MEHKIIHTENYLLIVDESEIKGKGFRLDLKRNSVGFIDDDIYYNERKDEFKKIISHLPLNNSPILEGLDLLPSLHPPAPSIPVITSSGKRLIGSLPLSIIVIRLPS